MFRVWDFKLPVAGSSAMILWMLRKVTRSLDQRQRTSSQHAAWGSHSHWLPWLPNSTGQCGRPQVAAVPSGGLLHTWGILLSVLEGDTIFPGCLLCKYPWYISPNQNIQYLCSKDIQKRTVSQQHWAIFDASLGKEQSKP